jgi:hypothetical protein
MRAAVVALPDPAAVGAGVECGGMVRIGRETLHATCEQACNDPLVAVLCKRGDGIACCDI